MSSAPVLRLLGPPRVSTAKEEVVLPEKQIALLAFLAHRAPRAVLRQDLAALIWPESGHRKSRHSLSQAIYKIRACLGKDVVEGSPSSVALGRVTCDWVNFKRLIKQGYYDKTADLIQGQFCDDLVIWDCVALNQWLDSVRAEFHGYVMRVLDEPLHETTRERINRALSFTEEVSMPHVEMADAISGSSCGFVGRVEERRKLEDLWERSQKGQIVTALVIGDPGIGKTALCRRTVKKTVLHGARAIMAVGYEVQQKLPYGICGQLLDEVRQGVQRASDHMPAFLDPFFKDQSELSRWHSSSSKGETGHRMAGIIHSGLKHLSQDGPLTVFVDDVQWSDPASLGVLHYVAHCEPTLPILFIFASRSGGLEAFDGERWKLDASISLKGLDLEESKSLIHELQPEIRDDATLKRIHEISGGNPLLLRAYATKERHPGSALPPSVKQYFQREAARLRYNSQLVGAALAAVGGSLPSSQLTWLTGLNAESTNAGIEELVLQSFVSIDRKTGAITLKHDSAGEAFLNTLTPVALATLHGRTARMLRDRGSAAAIVATQMTAAGDEQETAKYALEAARASLQLYAYREAEHFFRIAIATAWQPTVELNGRIGLANILLRQGRSNEAQAVLEECVVTEQLDGEQRALLEAHLLISQLAGVAPPSVPKLAFQRAVLLEPLLPAPLAARLFAAIAGNAQQGLHYLVEACAKAARRPIERLTAQPEQIQWVVRFSAFRAINAVGVPDLDELDRLIVKSATCPVAFAACLSDVALIRISLGHVKDAEAQCAQALQVCEQYGFLDERLRVLNNLGVCYLEQGRWAEAQNQFEAVVRYSGPVAAKEVASALSNLLILDYERGESERVIKTGGGCLSEKPLQTRLRIGSIAVLGLAYLELGQVSRARRCYDDILSSSAFDSGWSSDISYLEMLIARLTVIDGYRRRAKHRLRKKIGEFSKRDFFCAARMKIEFIRLAASDSPEYAIREGEALRPLLTTAHATPLINKVDSIIARSRARMAH